MRIDPQSYMLYDNRGAKPALMAGMLGVLLCIAGFIADRQQFFYSYLTAYVFWLTIALGGLFFTMLQHLTGARWSVVLRRISENVMANLPFMILLFLPLLFGLSQLFEWTHADVVAKDHLLQHKAPYLNKTFFIIRACFFFAVWGILSRRLYKGSTQQDASSDDIAAANWNSKLRRISAPGMILFALTTSFAAFDWLMSLDAHWYSTMFGVYIFAGTVLAGLAFITLVALNMRRKLVLHDKISVEHYHDLGKLLFAFTIFWAYITFCQYMLIWYSAIPEETVWYFERWQGSWKVVSLFIVFGHFVLPFMTLLGREPKRNPAVLFFMGFWILAIHWVDLHWIVLPNLHHHGVSLSWIDFAAMLGVGGLFLWRFIGRLDRKPLVPVKDPHLETSLHFENA